MYKVSRLEVMKYRSVRQYPIGYASIINTGNGAIDDTCVYSVKVLGSVVGCTSRDHSQMLPSKKEMCRKKINQH